MENRTVPELQAAPAEIRQAIDQLIQQMQEAAGENLVSVLLYGGLAKGRYRPGKSDVNLLVVLRRTDAAGLEAIAGPLRDAWRSIQAEPFILGQAEIVEAADVFPTKFLDIAAGHVVLFGEDPIASLAIDPRFVELRVEQELRNLLLRLRRRYVMAGHDPAALASTLSDLAPSLSAPLRHLLRLVGEEADGEPAKLLRGASIRFKLDGEALAELPRLYSHTGETGDVRELYARILAALEQAVKAVERLEETR